MNYTLMVEATADDNQQQTASDIVGPITLTGGSAACEYNIAVYIPGYKECTISLVGLKFGSLMLFAKFYLPQFHIIQTDIAFQIGI